MNKLKILKQELTSKNKEINEMVAYRGKNLATNPFYRSNLEDSEYIKDLQEEAGEIRSKIYKEEAKQILQ